MPSSRPKALAALRQRIPASIVAAAVEGARRRGLSIEQQLRAVGADLDPSSTDGSLAPDQFAQLLRRLTTELGDESNGFLSSPMRLGSFAMLCHACAGAPTLRRALQRAARFCTVLTDELLFTLTVEGEEALVQLRFPQQTPARYFVESVFIIIIRWASWLVDTKIITNRVSLGFAPPPYVAHYEVMFPGQHLFDQRHNYVAFSSRYLDLPVVQDSAALRRFLAVTPGALLRQHRRDVSASGRLRQLLRSPNCGDIGLEDAASALHCSAASLRRHLQTEGTSFQEMKDAARRDQAVYWLLHEDTPVNAIAERLGYSEPSTFHRAFKKWTGRTPGQYRSVHRAERPEQ